MELEDSEGSAGDIPFHYVSSPTLDEAEDQAVINRKTKSLSTVEIDERKQRPVDRAMSVEEICLQVENHSQRMLEKMAALREREHRLCDVVLKVGSREIYAHRVVLSACSNYFCAMFTNRMMESRQETVTLSDLDGDAVESLVTFAYTSAVSINEKNVQPLLKASAILQLSEIVEASCKFLSDQLHPSNCLGIAAFAEAHGCKSLRESTREFIKDHFVEVIMCDEFLHLPPEELKRWISCDYIEVTSEEMVFDALYRWLQHDLKMREKYASEMLCCVRLPLLKPLFLVEQVYSKQLFKTNSDCVEQIMNAMIYHTVEEKKAQIQVSDVPRKSTMGTVFAIGGMDTCRNKGSIECFDARKNQWELISHSQATCRRLQFGVTVLDSCIYIVGGRNGLRTLNTVHCYDPRTNGWDTVTPMCSYRHGVGVGFLNGPMYAVGGHDGWSYLASVERYDPSIEQWSYISSMHFARSTAGVAVLDGKLYVVGGRDSNSCLNCVESYDPHTDRWTIMPSMNTQRGGVGVAVVNGKLYAIGGHELSDPLNTAEVYDPQTKVWTRIAPMNSARDAVAAVNFGEKLFAVGGFDGAVYLDSVECYDAESDSWTVTSQLVSGRAGAGVVVMNDVFMRDLP